MPPQPLPTESPRQKAVAAPPAADAVSLSPNASTVHAVFEEQAAATPDADAILFADRRHSYAWLNRRANRLAHHLIRRGVRRGDLVGLCVRRCPELLVGLLGILKAGAAYVPLDPAYPDERLAFLLDDTAAPLVLAHGPTADRLRFARNVNHARVLCLDASAAQLDAEPDHNPAAGATADDLVYVMYTSGSTGTPKGVLVGHRAVVRLVRDVDYCRFGPGEVFLHLAPLAFDASTFEIWGPLLNGSALALLPPVPPGPDELATAIRRHGVTTLWLTAGLFHLVVEQRPEALAPLGQLVAGGDVLSPTHVARALDTMADGVLVNGYGPTESTTFACCFRMTKGYRPGTTIPIGRPVAGRTAHVLDERLRPVPSGAPGELYLGGDGLARGYLNNPELTREKFVPDPFGNDPSARLYRTGDRARWCADGTLEFLGRLDDQVKISGHRVEPGEVETTLLRHPAVRQAAVIARSQPRGDKQLVAYVVIAPSPYPLPLGGEGRVRGVDGAADTVKRYLADRLPPHMVPAHVVRLERLPLNANGKVDRTALPAPDGPALSVGRIGNPSDGAAVPRSRTELEEKVAAVWRRVLDRVVGPEDVFFDLGGSSLQLLEVHAELSRMLGREVPVTALFEHVTVRALAGWLAGAADLDPALSRARDRARRQKDVFTRHKSPKGNGE
jgi:amino acid adenylation domain-containing protein